MKDENLALGSKFAKNFNKKYGVVTYSGTLAIEIALQSLGLKQKAKILVSSNVCYSIINTIIKLNMVPVIKLPQNNLFLTDSDIKEVFTKQRIDCILLVHQFGLFNNIDILMYKNMGIKIIEDAAQIWNINNKKNCIVGKYSDIIVTSFGKTKPISYGIGGALFFNDNYILEKIDFCDNTSREKNELLFSYVYPLCKKMDYNKLASKANKVVKKQRNSADEYSKLLSKQHQIQYLDSKVYSKNVWHRFPIWVADDKVYKKLIILLEKSDLEYQLPHSIELINLPLCKNCIKIYNKSNVTNQILLRTRGINIKKQIKILKNILLKIDKMM